MIGRPYPIPSWRAVILGSRTEGIGWAGSGSTWRRTSWPWSTPSGCPTRRPTSAAGCRFCGSSTAASPGPRPPGSAGLGRATVQRYVAAYRDGGLDGLRRWGVTGPVSDLATHTDAIRGSLTTTPVRTIPEAADRIDQLTGIRRQPTQTRMFLAGLGFTYKRVRAIPIPPKKLSPSMSRRSVSSSTPR